jgi:hypothetical protein
MRTFLLSTALVLGACNSGTGTRSLGAQCPDSPATDVFDDTVCVCEDFGDIGNLIVGRSVATDHATLAVNGASRVLNNTQVRGDFIPYGGLRADGNVEVTHAISSAAGVAALGNVEAGTDLELGGDLTGIGRLAVDGTLRVGGDDRFVGWREVSATGPYGTTPEPPCGCDPATLFDVVAAVDAARTSNDNGAAGLPTSLRNIGWTDLTLESGTYYFDDIGTIGATRITIDGAVALHVDGNLDNIGAEWIRLAPGAVLDLYVSGAVRTIGHVELGDRWAPSSFRLYIGGEEECAVNVGNQIFNGAIYAPRAVLRYIGNTQIRGAVFAKRITGIGNLEVGYAAPEPPPQDCPPQGEDPPPDDDDGEPPVVL